MRFTLFTTGFSALVVPVPLGLQGVERVATSSWCQAYPELLGS